MKVKDWNLSAEKDRKTTIQLIVTIFSSLDER